MASPAGIKEATQRLQGLLSTGAGLGAGAISLVPPDVVPQADANGRINLYLLRIEESAQLRNQGIGTPADPIGHLPPPLALELHYLLTTHVQSEASEAGELLAQDLLGRAMVALHEGAIAVLGAEKERLRISFEPAGLEELTKVWTAMPEANYRRSVLLKVTVLRLRSGAPPALPKPVATRRLLVGAARRRPRISAAYHRPANAPLGLRDPRVRRGEILTLEGEHFLGERTFVQLGALVPIQVVPAGDRLLSVTVPNAAALQDGPLSVIVVTEAVFEVTEGGLGPATGGTTETRPLASDPVPVELVA